MKSKKMRFYGILSMMLLGGISVFSGCMDSNDVYNPDRLQEEAKKAFPVKDIDPNQTWETSAICNASVAVNEKTGGTYTIKVYTENPYNTDGNAHLLAKTSVKDGQTVNFKFDIPATLQYVYVMKVNSEGYSSAVPVAVENGSAKVTFGETGTVAQAAKSRTVSTRAKIDWTPTELPTQAPEGSHLYNNQYNVTKGGNYIITSNTTLISVDNPINLYIQGEVTLKSLWIGGIPWDAPAGIYKIFLLPNSKLTVVANSALGEMSTHEGNFKYFAFQAGLEIGICESAELKCQEMIDFDSNVLVYNKGTITAKKVLLNVRTKLINDSKIVTTAGVSCENEDNQMENNGEIVAGSFKLAGSSSFYNGSAGKVKISGNSDIDSNNSVWNNEGEFRTKNITFSSTSKNWINKCKLYVENDFRITTSSASFILDAGSYVECNDFYMDMARIEMGNGSFFNVNGTAHLKWNIGPDNGFVATGSNKALLKIGKAVPNNPNEGYQQRYSGNLYVACNDHFSKGTTDTPHYTLENGAQMTGTDNAEIKIPSSECNPGYNSIPDSGGTDAPFTYAYAFEDMMKEAGDYDFNDVVLFVTTPYEKEGKRVIDVTLKAAGASKLLSVLFNGQAIFDNVHTALGVAEGTIVNTGAATGTPRTVTIEVGENFNLTNNGDFYISDGQREIHIPNFTTNFTPGDAPYALRIAYASWKWPKERVQITEAYSGFANWANDATQAPDWYNSCNSDKVIGIE